METSEKAAEVLNDLLKINNDRIVGYKRAIDEVRENDLKVLFEMMLDGSKKFANSLRIEINKLDGEAKAGSTTRVGETYRVWVELKATFNGKDREGILDACEYVEEAAQSAYQCALDGGDIQGNLRNIVMLQKVSLRVFLGSIRQTRNNEKISLLVYENKNL